MTNFFALLGVIFAGLIVYYLFDTKGQKPKSKPQQSAAMKEVMTMLKDVFQFPKQNGVYFGSFINSFGKEEFWMLVFVNSQHVYLYPVNKEFQNVHAATLIKTVYQETRNQYKGSNGELVVSYTVTLQGVKMTFGNVKQIDGSIKQIEINGILNNNILLAEISFKKNFETKTSHTVKFHFIPVS